MRVSLFLVGNYCRLFYHQIMDDRYKTVSTISPAQLLQYSQYAVVFLALCIVGSDVFNFIRTRNLGVFLETFFALGLLWLFWRIIRGFCKASVDGKAVSQQSIQDDVPPEPNKINTGKIDTSGDVFR